MSLPAAALRQLRAGGRRTVLSAVGLLLAGMMAGAALVVAYSLGTGFDRAVERSDLPDVVARFDDQPRERIDALVRALPNVEDRSYRLERGRVPVSANGRSSDRGSLQLVDASARRGYLVVEGEDLRAGQPGMLVERGLADAWDLELGDRVDLFDPGNGRPITGIAVAPDNVAFPLAAAPRVYTDLEYAEANFNSQPGSRFFVNEALIWTANPDRTDITLQQARATTAQVKDLRFITVAGVRVLIDQAAGIVIALLGAFSLLALGAAGIMLASQAAADVQRRLGVIGVQRAIGVARGRVAAEHALAAALLGLVAAGAGVVAGAVVVAGPADALLRTLNELGPGPAMLLPLAAAIVAIALLSGLAAGYPAWRAAGRTPVALLRGAELRGPARSIVPGSGPFALGVRLAVARRGRAALAVAVLAASGALVLLMLGLATLLTGLRDDPGSLGKRYALTVRLPSDRVGEVRALPGVDDAGARYVVRGADSFSLGEPVKVVAFPGDHTRFEDPPLAEGRRLRTDGEAEIGLGLASALGVAPGGTLAVQLPSGAEARFRVVGTVRALEDDGRVAYVRPPRVLDAEPGLQPEVVIRPDAGADEAALGNRLRAIGAEPAAVGGATSRSAVFLDTLANLLRVVALLDALVCLYALVQALGLVARERRPTLALLRATGAPASTIRLVLLGAALAFALPAVVLAAALERWVLAPLTGDLAAGYADLRAARRGPRRSGWPRPSSPWRCSPRCAWRAGSSPSRPSSGCGRSDGPAPLTPRADRAPGLGARSALTARRPTSVDAPPRGGARPACAARCAARAAGPGGRGHRRRPRRPRRRRRPRAPLGVDAAGDLGRPGRRRRAGARAGRAAAGPHRSRPRRDARPRARDTRADHRHAHPRRGVPGARELPRPARRALHPHVPPAGGAHHPGVRGGSARARRRATRPAAAHRRHHRQRDRGRVSPGALGAAPRRARGPRHRRPGLRRPPASREPRPGLLPP